eukprot:scaffold29122_cov100-Skeletonema_dohrnii-CCMP3373.AAC.2
MRKAYHQCPTASQPKYTFEQTSAVCIAFCAFEVKTAHRCIHIDRYDMVLECVARGNPRPYQVTYEV